MGSEDFVLFRFCLYCLTGRSIFCGEISFHLLGLNIVSAEIGENASLRAFFCGILIKSTVLFFVENKYKYFLALDCCMSNLVVNERGNHSLGYILMVSALIQFM